MSLVGFGSLGHTPDECIEKCAEVMMLQGAGDEPINCNEYLYACK